MEITIRPLHEDDLERADRIMRVAFGTFVGHPDPPAMFGDAEYVRTRLRAAPDQAWAAEIDGELVGTNFATRWGSFAFFGPLTVAVERWDSSVGTRLMEPVTEAFAGWELRQAGLFTFPHSAKHIGLYQKHGFWPRMVHPLMSKAPVGGAGEHATWSALGADERADAARAVAALTGAVLPGLDVTPEIIAVAEQGLGETLLLSEDGELTGVAVCHTGAGSEAGSGACYVKFGAVAPGDRAAERFGRLLDACDTHAAAAGLQRIVAGVNAGRVDAYRLMLERGYRIEMVGLAMRSRPEEPGQDGPEQFVIDDLR